MKIKFFLSAIMLFYTALSFSQPGSLDSNFSKNGKVNIPAGRANALIALDDGRIVTAGNSKPGFTLVRYTHDGFLDSSFGIAGKTTLFPDDYNYDNVFYSLATQANKKLIAAGTDGKNFVLVRLKYNGLPDSSFGINGKVTTSFSGKKANASFVTIQPDNKIIAVGSAVIIKEDLFRIAVARYNTDGSLDKSFGNGGKLIIDLHQSGFDMGTSIILQADGKMVVIGTSYVYHNTNSGNDFALFRINTNGGIDSSFGSKGYTFTDFGDYEVTSAAATQTDGRIIVAGYSNFHEHLGLLARYTKNGKLDSSFGKKGEVVSVFNGNNDAAYSLAIQPDNKIVVAGSSNMPGIEAPSNTTYFMIGRFTKNGIADNSFGINGKVATFFKTDSADAALAIALKPNGKIIAAGEASGNFALVRYNGDTFSNLSVAHTFLPIEKNKLLSGFELFPNPARDFISVVAFDDVTDARISVTDMNGRTLYITKQNFTANQEIKIPASQFAKQVLFITINTNNGKQVFKVIKQ